MTERGIEPEIVTNPPSGSPQAGLVAADPGAEPCEYLDWDSSFFGFRIARVRSNRADRGLVGVVMRWCDEHRIDCLYFLADACDPITVRVAEDAGFRFVDVRATFEWQPGRTYGAGGCEDGSIRIRAASADDRGALLEIARTNYQTTRFRFDAGFPQDRVDALYETWTEKSCLGYADTVLVADGDDGPYGYITCHIDGVNAGRIGLIGVRGEAQGRGIGRALIHSALTWFAARGVARVRVVTQGRNIAAQRLYERCGFLIEKVDLWYHHWFGDV